MLSNPVYDPYQILTKIYSEGAHLKQAIADTYIEEINRARTVKIVYGVLENDLYFDFCIRRYAPKAPKLAVRTLLKISLYMLLFMDKPRYMVTDSAVELCKKLGKSGVSGFVNAFLRRFPARKRTRLFRRATRVRRFACRGRFGLSESSERNTAPARNRLPPLRARASACASRETKRNISPKNI